MTDKRAKAIIAVFGGEDRDAVATAKKLGAEIARRGQILLTGGSAPGTKYVKDSAIDGVGSSPWVGVERKPKKVAASESGSGLVIYTDLDNKRNYLEACLCDAAIGLKGGDGTISEVTFALALQRPVVLVGDHWKAEGSLDGSTRQAVLASMVQHAFTRVRRTLTGRPDFDALLNEVAIRGGLEQLPPFTYVSSSNPPEDAIDWILKVLASRHKAGGFPALAGYRDVAQTYRDWLATHAV